MKFLAVLAVLAMAFAAVAVILPTGESDAVENANFYAKDSNGDFIEITDPETGLLVKKTYSTIAEVVEDSEAATIVLAKSYQLKDTDAANIVKPIDLGTKNFRLTVPATKAFQGTVQFGTINVDNTETTISVTTDASFKAGDRPVYFTAGSVEISGTILADGTTITATDGVILKNVTLIGGDGISNTLTINGPASVQGTLDVGVDVTLTANKLVVTANATVYIEDKASLVGTTVINNGKIYLMGVYDNDDSPVPNNLTGTGSVLKGISADVLQTLYVDNSMATTTYDPNQKVVIRGNVTVGTENVPAIVYIPGALEILSGSKLTILGNSLVILANGAVADIDGNIVIEEKVEDFQSFTPKPEWDIATLNGIQGLYTKFGTLNVSGDSTIRGGITLDSYAPQIGGDFTVKDGAQFNLANSGSLEILSESTMTVEKDSKANLQGTFTATNIANSGSIVLKSNNPISGNVKISLLDDGASIEIQKVTFDSNGYNLTITDDGLVFYNYKTDSKDIVPIKVEKGTASFPANEIVIKSELNDADLLDSFQGLIVVEKTSSKNGSEDDIGYSSLTGKTYTNKMDISGSLKARQEVAEGAPSTTEAKDPKIDVSIYALRAGIVAEGKNLEIGLNIKVTNEVGSKISVEGYIDANTVSSSSTSAKLENKDGATFTMVDLGILEVDKRLTTGVVKGAMIVYDDNVKYMDIDVAIDRSNVDASIEYITVVGPTDVSYTASLRPGVSIVVNPDLDLTEPNMSIGMDDSTVVLTVETDAQVRGTGSIQVDGTLYAKNKSNVSGHERIIADVYSEQVDASGKAPKDGWAKWTNIITALNEAEKGSKVTVNKSDLVTLKNSTEVKEGVTLVVPSTCAGLILNNGVTLTVNGVFENSGDHIYAQTQFKTEASNVTGNRASAIVVNGLMKNESDFYGYDPATADYTGDDPAMMKDINGGAPISGAYFDMDNKNCISTLGYAVENAKDIKSNIVLKGTVTGGTVVFTGSDECDTIEIFGGQNGVETVVTITEIILNEATLKGAYTLDEKGEFNGKVSVGDSTVTLKGMSSNSDAGFTVTDDDDKLVIGGVYYMADKGDSFSVTAGEIYTSAGLSVAGDKSKVTVASDASLISDAGSSDFRDLVVNGTLMVPNGKTITVSNELAVYGTVIVDSATESLASGTLQSSKMFVGMSSKDMTTKSISQATSAVASIIGPIQKPTIAYVLDGTVFDDDAKAVLDDFSKKTEFYVKDKLWITVYTDSESADYVIRSATEYNYVPVDLENCDFVSWQYLSSGDYKDVAENAKIGSHDKVYAKINYEIYTVKIVTDSGIKAVSIDGIQMLRSPAAGVGTNTFVTLHPIEAGSHKVTYTLQDGYEGTAALYTEYGTILQNLSFTVSGTDDDQRDVTFQLYGTEKEVPAEPEEESEWTVTTILLLILVILIAVMAVIVAMRLMRS